MKADSLKRLYSREGKGEEEGEKDQEREKEKDKQTEVLSNGLLL